jgi:hypothetical protein
LGVSAIPIFLSGFQDWNAGYSLLIGNEATLDRPWRGSLQRLALYGGVSSHNGLGGKSLSSFSVEKTGPVQICAWRFDIGFGDTVGTEPSSVLTLRWTGNPIRWRSDGTGIEVARNSVLRAVDSAAGLVRALAGTGVMSVAMRIRTADPRQNGPARILSFSQDTGHRNFTVGQQGSDIHFRVRTRLAGPNGSRICLVLPNALPDTSWHDLLLVFNRGYAQGTVDGKTVNSTLRIPDQYIPEMLHMGSSALSLAVFWVAILLPFGIGTARGSGWKRFVSVCLACFGLWIAVRIMLWLWIRQPLGF